MKRGEIYVVDLGPVVGHEAGGVRPVVVVSNDVANLVPVLVAVVPTIRLADSTTRAGVVVPAGRSGYPDDLVALATHVRVLDASRFPEHPAGSVPVDLMAKIDLTLKVLLDLP
ncbi:MAG TPA: type II toxin-antitoxin system PemK/MazF family toxin [Gemmata sp.]